MCSARGLNGRLGAPKRRMLSLADADGCLDGVGGLAGAWSFVSSPMPFAILSMGTVVAAVGGPLGTADGAIVKGDEKEKGCEV